MERFKLNTDFYRSQIKLVHPRLNAHMITRGVDQRMAFHWYYAHFGLQEPFPLESAFQDGLIVARKNAAWFKSNKMDAYNLTHEIFVPYRFGEDLSVDFFKLEDKEYLRGLFEELVPWYIGQNETDLLAEFILCLSYLKMTDLSSFRSGVGYLLDTQNENGSWGRYENERLFMGDYVDQGLYLHTTMVAMDALVIAFN